MDYGHDLHFGVFVAPDATRYDEVLTAALEADLLGLASVSVQDHPYQPAFLDTWTLLSHIATRTERITVVPNVANLPLRPPAVLGPQRRVARHPDRRAGRARARRRRVLGRHPISESER